MSSNAVIIVLVLIVLAILGYFTLRPMATSPSTTIVVPEGSTTATPTPLVSPTESVTPSGSDSSTPLQESYTLKASNYAYDVQLIRAKLNDQVKILLMNTQGTHDLVIEGYNVSTKMLKEGQSQTVQFVANKPGTFEYYCNVGNHRAMGMTGQLIVE